MLHITQYCDNDQLLYLHRELLRHHMQLLDLECCDKKVLLTEGSSRVCRWRLCSVLIERSGFSKAIGFRCLSDQGLRPRPTNRASRTASFRCLSDQGLRPPHPCPDKYILSFRCLSDQGLRPPRTASVFSVYCFRCLSDQGLRPRLRRLQVRICGFRCLSDQGLRPLFLLSEFLGSVSDACQIKDLDYASSSTPTPAPLVSDACQIKDLDHPVA